MVFFLLVFSMGSLDLEKSSGMIGSLQSGLGVLEAGTAVDVAVIDPQPSIQSLENEMGNLSEVYNEILTDLTEYEREIPYDDEIGKAVNYLPYKRMNTVDVIPGVSASYTADGIFITLADHLLFKSGEASINHRAYPVLDRIVKNINNTQYHIRIEGHTDDIPIHTKKYPTNWELSIDRAIHVLRYFIQYGNVSPTRLSAVGYGDSKPIALSDSDQNRAINRRVEIVLYRKGHS